VARYKPTETNRLLNAVQTACESLGWNWSIVCQDKTVCEGEAWLTDQNGMTKSAVSVLINFKSGEITTQPSLDGIHPDRALIAVGVHGYLFQEGLPQAVRRYLNDPDAGLHPKKRERNKRIRELRAQNYTIPEIAEEVDCSEETVERVLGLRK